METNATAAFTKQAFLGQLNNYQFLTQDPLPGVCYLWKHNTGTQQAYMCV